MISKRTYYVLGLVAVLVALVSLVLSITMYILGFSEYLWYSIIWLVILVLDIIAWKTPPKQLKSRDYKKVIDSGDTKVENLCSELREAAELVSIIYTLSNTSVEGYSVSFRMDSLIARLSRILDTITNYCSENCRNYLNSILKGEVSNNMVEGFLISLNKCMAQYECESNIVIED